MDTKEKNKGWRETAEVMISDDKTEAYLLLREEAKDCTAADVIEFLNRHKVIYGIDEARILIMLSEKELHRPVLVAKGHPLEIGRDGYYKYYFNTKPVEKPIILEDGTVDYNTLGTMELCRENDLLVEYYPAVQGKNGISVMGTVLAAPVYKDLKPLKGKGFNIAEDANAYYASFDGKIEFEENRLRVTQMYVVHGDMDANTGDISFYGDVLVTGNVSANSRIEAAGNITIDGSVETAVLVAGKNVILRNGMQGNGKGSIFAKGDVSAKFFEQTFVTAKGNVNANSIMNCDIRADGKVIVNGRRGAIIGGRCQAIELIQASVIGNQAEAKTMLVIGTDKDFYDTLDGIEADIEELTKELSELERKMDNIGRRLKMSQTVFLTDQRKALMKEKIEKSARYNEQLKRKEELLSQKERSAQGAVVVSGRAFPAVTVLINGAQHVTESVYRNVTFLKKENEIKIFSNSLR